MVAILVSDICVSEYERAWRVNVQGTSSFVQTAIDRGFRVVFFSAAVFDERLYEFDEKAACNSAGEYAEMKREVEQRLSS